MSSLATLRNAIITSIHGRRLGFDVNDMLVGPKAMRQGITSATSATTGTALPNNGIVSVVTTTNDTWTLTDPVSGCEVLLHTGSTSTGTHTITCDNAVIYSTNGLEGASVVLSNRGAYAKLMGLSTSAWMLTGRASTAVASVSS